MGDTIVSLLNNTIPMELYLAVSTIIFFSRGVWFYVSQKYDDGAFFG